MDENRASGTYDCDKDSGCADLKSYCYFLRKIYKNKIKNGKEVAELPFC
jgi:hypothetical protein